MNHDTPVGEGLILYGGPAVVNGNHVEDVQLLFPLASKDLRLRWTAADGVESRDQAVIVFEHPRLGTCRAEGFVLDTSGFGTIDSTVIGDSGVLVEYVISGWVNMPSMGSTTSQVDDYSTVFESAGWRLGLFALPPFIEREKHVRRVGIPVYVSHKGRLSRVDGRRFSANEALDVLLAFQVALSFVIGRFVSPLAPNGCDGDELHWVLTPHWFCTEGLGREGILFPRDTEDFGDAVARLATTLLTSRGATALRYLAMHAIASNTAGLVEQRLMTAQAGLEFHAWHHLVVGEQLTATEAGKLSAAQRIERALNTAQIPHDIPEELEALIDQATDPDEFDVPTTGPGVGTWVRNRISHPKDPDKPYAIDKLVFQASVLMREYLELLILHHIEYQGSWRRMYPEGRWEGDSEQVPWSTKIAEP